MNKTKTYLNSFTWCSNSSQTQSGHFRLFHTRAMVKVKVQILIAWATPVQALDSASITECMTVGLRRSWKCYFHCLTISSVEGSRIPLPLYRVWVECHFTLLIFLMFYENLFQASQKSYSMVSPNSSHTCVFASATARLTLHLAWEHLSAAMESHRLTNPNKSHSLPPVSTIWF